MSGNTVILPGRPSGGLSDEDRALYEAVDAEARENWGDLQWQRDRLQDLAVTIWEGFESNNYLEQFTTVENAGEFEPITVEEVRGVQVYWVAEGGAVRETTVDGRIWELTRDKIGYHVVENIRKIRSGYSKWWNQLTDLAPAQIEAEISARLFRTFQAAVPDTSPYYTEQAGLSLPTVNTMLAELEDTITDNEGLAIVGRGLMTKQIWDELQADNNFAPNVQEEIIRTGSLGTYRGVPIVSLKNFRDLYDRPIFPGNELWIVAKSASKVGKWGGMMSQNWDEQGGEYHHEWGVAEVGFAVHRPDLARRIVDTNL